MRRSEKLKSAMGSWGVGVCRCKHGVCVTLIKSNWERHPVPSCSSSSARHAYFQLESRPLCACVCDAFGGCNHPLQMKDTDTHTERESESTASAEMRFSTACPHNSGHHCTCDFRGWLLLLLLLHKYVHFPKTKNKYSSNWK